MAPDGERKGIMKECIMVVDFGTSNARTNLVNIKDGKIEAGFSKPVFYNSPRRISMRYRQMITGWRLLRLLGK